VSTRDWLIGVLLGGVMWLMYWRRIEAQEGSALRVAGVWQHALEGSRKGKIAALTTRVLGRFWPPIGSCSSQRRHQVCCGHVDFGQLALVALP
jgi:hypothetical protein